VSLRVTAATPIRSRAGLRVRAAVKACGLVGADHNVSRAR